MLFLHHLQIFDAFFSKISILFSRFCSKILLVLFQCTIFFISNLVAKAPGLNLGKKSGNFLSNRDALNKYSSVPNCREANLQIWEKTLKFIDERMT